MPLLTSYQSLLAVYKTSGKGGFKRILRLSIFPDSEFIYTNIPDLCYKLIFTCVDKNLKVYLFAFIISLELCFGPPIRNYHFRVCDL
jgi:hypothetical protein